MNSFGLLGKIFIVTGVLLIFAGMFFVLANRIPFLGKLPGDIYIHKKHFSFFFPITTSIIVSIILTILLNLFLKR